MSDQIAINHSNTPIRSLRKRSDFLRLRSGRRYHSSLFTLQFDKRSGDGSSDECRVGYTVTTKEGNAVERNRIKRRMRAAVARVFPEAAKAGADYVIIARRDCLDVEFAAIRSELSRALDHLNTNKAKRSKPHRAR